MRTPGLFGMVAALLLPIAAAAAPIFVNEYNAVSAANFLDGTAADTTLGRVQGNGGDWIELAVIQDHFDLRGGSLSIEEGNAPGRSTTVLTFTQDSLWSDLRSGTIITVSEAGDLPAPPPYDPVGGSWWINVQASDTASGQFITASNFSVSNDNTQITVLDAFSQPWFGPAGEGIQPPTGVGSTEVWKLEANPSASITPTSNFKDGSSSTYGAPNRWSSGTLVQDFSALRSVVVPEPEAATLFGVALAALFARWRAPARAPGPAKTRALRGA